MTPTDLPNHSMTKPIASVGLIKLYEQGKLHSTIPCTGSFRRGRIFKYS